MKPQLLSGCLVLITAVSLVRADVMVVEKRHTDSYTVMGKTEPAKDETVTIWIGDQQMRSDGPDGGVLVLLDKGKVYVIDHNEKKYSEIPSDVFEKRTDASSAESMPEGMPSFMQNMMTMKVSVEPTGETGTVGSWNCRKYLQQMEFAGMKTSSELWANADLKVAPKLMGTFLAAYYGRNGEMKDMMGNLLDEMKKIEGYVVKTVTTSTVMGTSIRSVSEVTKLDENATAPAGTYELPPKYRKKSWGK